MTFLAPLMLLGLVGVAIPLVIHLIGRRRARVVKFAALAFLIGSKRKTSRRPAAAPPGPARAADRPGARSG